MNDLHLTLMEQPAGRRYRELFARLAPSLPGLRATLGRDDISDTELAFRALYAAMLYRIKGARAEVSDEVVQLVSPVVALLADTYHKVERGEMDVYKDNG
jgi:flagellin-specific chaperone FliS